MTVVIQEKINSEFYDRAGKYFSGEMSDSEVRDFLNTCNQSQELKKELVVLKDLWEITTDYTLAGSVDPGHALNGLRKKLFPGSGKNALQRVLVFLEKAAAILFIPLLAAFIWYYLSSQPVKDRFTVMNEVENAFGTVSKLTLSDGTKVWLNSGSSFKYPLVFSRKERKVYLSGEAYFEVAKDKKRPFVVNASVIDVMATGTVFDVMAYEGDEKVISTLVSGRIKMVREKGSYNYETIVDINPGYMAVLDKSQKNVEVKRADIDKMTAWKDGKLIFRNDPIDEVIKKLNRWYNADIILVDNELRSYRYTATFTSETLPQILELLKRSAPIKYHIYPRKKKADDSFTKEKVEIRLRKEP